MGAGPWINDRAESLTHHNEDGHVQNFIGAQGMQTKMSARGGYGRGGCGSSTGSHSYAGPFKRY
jgi:hypothetical protein